MGGSVHDIKKDTQALIVASEESGLEVSADKTEYMVMSRDQNAGRSHNMKVDNVVKQVKCPPPVQALR